MLFINREIMFSDSTSRLFSYIVAFDAGSAPNPNNGICTLAICKPNIRRVARPGDVILGLAPSPNNRRIVYCMIVDEVVSWPNYIELCNSDSKFSNRIPKNENDPGDCIWPADASENNMKALSSLSGHDDYAFETDVINGCNVLISYKYWYFGSGDKYKVILPDDLTLAPGRGHRSNANTPYIAQFKNFFLGWIKEHNINYGIHGTPALSPSAGIDKAAVVACYRISKEDDKFDEEFVNPIKTRCSQ